MPDDILPHQRIKLSWLVGTFAAFAIFLVIGAYSSRMTWDFPDYDHDRAQQRYANLKKTQDSENALLTGTAWVDQGKNVVRIPIDEAMAKEVDTLREKAPVAGVEINPPAAAPAPANPAPGTPAAPAKPNPAPPAKPGAKGSTPPAAGAPAPAAKPAPTNK
jgi:hypothetical protein